MTGPALDIARAALGGAGWVVYVTARSAAGQRGGRLPGTAEATAEVVTRAGGRGIAVTCDHRDHAAVTAVAGRIAAEHARLDLRVNNSPPTTAWT
jgi:NAD(P)-dependent dehydrogenase (short-subunit alcohol dehydrogenase family)